MWRITHKARQPLSHEDRLSFLSVMWCWMQKFGMAPKHATAVKYHQRCRSRGPQGTITLCPPSPQPLLICLFEGWGATFPANRHINRPHTWKETRLWRRLPGSRFCNESDANSGGYSKMASQALQETGHAHLNSNHLLGYTTLSKTSSVGLERRSATPRRPNYDFTSAEFASLPGFWKDGRAAAGEILGAPYEVRQFLFTSGTAQPGWVRQEIKWHHESVWLRAQ